jgi:hypothetical protein
MQLSKLIAKAAVAAAAALVQGISLTPIAQAAPFCPPGVSPTFQHGFAELQEHLGATVGQPLECQHGSAQNDDVIQHTTTGLFYYRPSNNTPIFTNGVEHYAITPAGLILWRSISVEPPIPTATEQAYLADAREAQNQAEYVLARLDTVFDAGLNGLVAVDVEELGSLLDKAIRARDVLNAASEPGRLESYDLALLNTAYLTAAAAETALRARITETEDARRAFLTEAESQAASSRQFMSEARNLYSYVLPVVVG